MIRKLAILALAGAAGTLCRYWLAGAVQRLWGSDLPVGTFAVNMAGCLLFGLVWGLLENRAGLSGEWRLAALTGFMGAFTTFSTFVFESGELMRDAQWLRLALNVGGQNAVGFAALFLGTSLGRTL